MYDEVCYKNNFLKEVIARIDFVVPLEGLEKSIPPKLANNISVHFPISEPTDAIAQELQIGPENVQSRKTHLKHWNFYGKEREKQLSLGTPFIFASYKRYRTYEDMKETFGTAVDALKKTFPDTRAARFGLRYINSIEIPGLNNFASWNDYITAGLLGTLEFFNQPEHLTRLIHICETKYDDMNMRFQFGMPNPDYPAVMKRLQFVLDFDAYIQSAHDLSESLQYMDQGHEMIQALFEKCITDELRSRMNG